MLHTISLHIIAIVVLMAFAPSSCAQDEMPQSAHNSPVPGDTLPVPPYRFDQPLVVFELPKKLKEISGLTVLDDQYVGAIQDEEGDLFILNFHTGALEATHTFEKKGDFEGLARVEDRLFALRSDGRLYEIADWRSKKPKVKKHKTKLSEKHDTEGLVYDAPNNRLLIACKEYPGKGLKNQKAIYAFDLEREQVSDDPVFTIDLDAFNAAAPRDNPVNARIRAFLQPATDLSGFKPSGLALHPFTRQLYILSSVRKVIVVLDEEGTFSEAWPLPEDLFRQPEGLAFLPNGDLLLSSEGAGGDAILARFTYQR